MTIIYYSLILICACGLTALIVYLNTIEKYAGIAQPAEDGKFYLINKIYEYLGKGTFIVIAQEIYKVETMLYVGSDDGVNAKIQTRDCYKTERLYKFHTTAHELRPGSILTARAVDGEVIMEHRRHDF